MTQGYRWNKASTRAAQLVAEDALTDEQIADQVGWSRASLTRLKRRPEFQARVASIVADTAAALKAKGIAEAQARIDDHVDLHKRLRQIIEERAADETWADKPGWKSGLLVHNIKQVGAGPYASTVDVFDTDTALVNTINANKKQIAQERGQWAEKRELTGKDGGPIKGDFTWSDLVKLAAEDEA